MKTLQMMLLTILLGLISSCGIVAKVQSRNDMMESKAQYKTCLRQNPANPNQCIGLKKAYEADLKAYRATSNGIKEGYSDSLDVTYSRE